jgi:hypothetical protein
MIDYTRYSVSNCNFFNIVVMLILFTLRQESTQTSCITRKITSVKKQLNFWSKLKRKLWRSNPIELHVKGHCVITEVLLNTCLLPSASLQIRILPVSVFSIGKEFTTNLKTDSDHNQFCTAKYFCVLLSLAYTLVIRFN